jgi:hypothetical protein
MMDGAAPTPIGAALAVAHATADAARDDAARRAEYLAFLEAKMPIAQRDGIEIDPAEVNPWLKPHAALAVRWACRGGRRGIFASFGLHKTSIDIEIQRLILKHAGGEGLITLPLGVRQEFFRDARSMGYDGLLRFIRRPEEIEKGKIHLTNYETVRDGKLDPALFTVTGLDEADVLRGFGGSKTFREFMRLFEAVKYRFVFTATPSPNEYIELLAYAAYLGIMDVGQAKTRFFRRDSENADHLTLHPHKEREFWLWVASWALFIYRPSDLGFSDDGYVLPELDVRWHEVPSDHARAGADSSGQHRMFHDAAIGVSEAARVKREMLHQHLFRLWRERSTPAVYDFAGHLAIGEELDRAGVLPSTFMLLPPHSWHEDVWSDVTRMRTLNGEQYAAGREMHLCPLQFDIVDRAILQYSMPGELIFDPFMGIGTVPVRALKLGRCGLGIELSPKYFPDAVAYCRAAEAEAEVPSLFDALEAEAAE